MTRRLLFAALAIALSTGPLVEPALAEKAKAKMTAEIDGKRFKGLDSKVTGTFRGTLPHSTDPSVPPVTIEEGRFTAFINDVRV